MDMDSIGSILNSLSDDDVDSLKSLASSLFSESKEDTKAEAQQTESTNTGFDFDSLTKIASVLSAFSGKSNDPRCNLLYAVKPLLKPERQHKVDEAVKMLKVIDLVPTLREQGIF